MGIRLMMSKRSISRRKMQPLALGLAGALLILLLAGFAGSAVQQSGRAMPGTLLKHTNSVGPSPSLTPSPSPALPTSHSTSLQGWPLLPLSVFRQQIQILAELGHPGKALLVSIANQTLYVYQGATLVNISYVTTGRPELQTPRGFYSILQRQHAVMFYSKWPPGSPYYYPPVFVNYALRFLGKDFFLHDYSPRHYYGPGTNVWHQNPDGTWGTGSHGCVEAPLAFMQWLYNWVSLGTPLVVY